jgi:hypothetical protein
VGLGVEAVAGEVRQPQAMLGPDRCLDAVADHAVQSSGE